ncbi:MAG: TRAP transporter large permease [Burkholderiales bacterium]|nr:TRAP transporter large permease [Burkholderiales bacterium]
MTLAITVGVLFALLLLRIPIALSLMLSGVTGYVLAAGVHAGLLTLPQMMYSALDSFVIAAIPLYLLMGQIMLKGEIGRDLFDIAQWAVGWLPGGLLVASITACAIFAAISGSSTATVATIGGVALPELLRRGHDRKPSAGSIAVAGSLGILIPPSTQFILYALVTSTSVGKLFAAGILPGLLLAVLFSLWAVIADLTRGVRPQGEAREAVRLRPGMIWGVLIIPLVLGGIYAGWFTPTEAAAVGVLYALFATAGVKRSLTWRSLYEALRDAVVSSGMILMLVTGADVFSRALSLLQVPQNIAAWMDTLDLSLWQFMIAVNLLYIVVGMFMDSSAAILVTVPILLPLLTALHIDLVWFGVILIINMEIGAVTPPVGMNLFVIQALRPDFGIGEILLGALPYVVMAAIGLALVIVFPQIALLLANRVG